jgi:hypothetical protein
VKARKRRRTEKRQGKIMKMKMKMMEKELKKISLTSFVVTVHLLHTRFLVILR